MQNWRHAGRFGTNFLPYATDGTTNTAGDLDIGSSGAPWKDLYLATGSSIYVGGTAFEGGGGGASVEVYEQKSHLEKVGYDYPLSNAQSQNESFMDSSAMVLTLGKTHLNTETSIYLDRDAYTISAISTASATAWYTGGTGTAATNTTAGESVNGTSVKYSVTATNTAYYIAASFTAFSMVDKDLKVWLYPDTKTNITNAFVRLYSAATTTGYAEWQVTAASITALTLNSFYFDVDNPATTGAAYNRASINEIRLGLVGTATPQAVQWSWNFIRSVDNRKLKVPVQMVCDNGTNQEFINITTATVSGDLYTLETITTNSHTISSTEIKLKQLDIAGGQGVIASGTTGEAALTGWDIQRTFMNTSTSGDLIITSRWYDESYPVATVTNASTTVLSITTSTVAAGYKSGDVVRLYKWEYVDQNYQSPVNSAVGSNFIDLTLTADGTATSSQLTLVHGNTSNQNLGGDTVDKWRGVRVSADDYYRVEAATVSQALVKATPTIWIPRDEGILYPSVAIAHWKMDGTVDEADVKSGAYPLIMNGTVPRVGGKFLGARGPFSTSNFFKWLASGSNATVFDTNNFMFSIWVYATSWAAGRQFIAGKNNGDTLTTGWSIYNNTGDVGKLTFRAGNSYLCVTNGVVPVNQWVHILVCNFDNSSANARFMILNGIEQTSTAPGETWAKAADDMLIGVGRKAASPESALTTAYVDDAVYFAGVPSTRAAVNALAAQIYAQGRGRTFGFSPGYIQKSTISSVSGSKLITATRLTRKDATNQNPVIYQRNAVIV